MLASTKLGLGYITPRQGHRNEQSRPILASVRDRAVLYHLWSRRLSIKLLNFTRYRANHSQYH
ncbi:hypothetical protein VCR29J2_480041 [Vibrio coralliirubri]|nr:hypothetical protein VCR29J2_480041 [Vibrio coralliirubri]